jgi:mono/diheme cytochrome c family protein
MMKYLATMVVFVVCNYVSNVTWAQAQVECLGFTSAESPGYEVTCSEAAKSAADCIVDANSYNGWKTYTGACASCHGEYGEVTTSFPNLLELLNANIDYDRFVSVLYHGQHGTVTVMPSWKGDCDVIPDIDNVYRYLKARADGRLPTGAVSP